MTLQSALFHRQNEGWYVATSPGHVDVGISERSRSAQFGNKSDDLMDASLNKPTVVSAEDSVVSKTQRQTTSTHLMPAQ